MNDSQAPKAPKYQQVKQEILSWIVSGKFGAHVKLPSENEICRTFGMSRQTVRQALGDLEQEGWLYREQGKGTFVSDQSLTERRSLPHGIAIGMITTYISDYIFPTIVRGVESSLRERGAKLLLASTENEKDKERQSLESMMNEPLSGLIIEPTKSAAGNPNFHLFLALDALRVPYVMLNERYSDIDAPCLRVNDELGGYQAAQHLIGLGHSRIAGFFKTDDFQGVYRMKGFVRALRERTISLPPEFLLRYTTEEKGRTPGEALVELLGKEAGQRPTAIVCYNDELAIMLLDVVRRLGLSVPGDLSIVGFDDASLATATEVKLTTFAHPKTEMGRDAVELLLGMVNGRSMVKVKDKVYEPTLIVRESTALCENNT